MRTVLLMLFALHLNFMVSSATPVLSSSGPENLVASTNLNQAEISWSCSASPQLDFFVLEKSVNGKEFQALDTALYNISDLFYKIVDLHPLNGRSYYRLKSVSMNGDFATSRIVALNYSEKIPFKFEVFPTPAKEKFSLFFSGIGDSNDQVYVKILNLRGKTILTLEIPPTEAQMGSFCVSRCENFLNPGTYVIICTYRGIASWQKIVIE